MRQSVYLDRLRDERRSIRNHGQGMTTLNRNPETQAGLLIMEAITNLADTIQTIHEEGSDQEE